MTNAEKEKYHGKKTKIIKYIHINIIKRLKRSINRLTRFQNNENEIYES